jgi:hypothetical protein
LGASRLLTRACGDGFGVGCGAYAGFPEAERFRADPFGQWGELWALRAVRIIRPAGDCRACNLNVYLSRGYGNVFVVVEVSSVH